jgi:hypothetical protein
MMAGQSLTDELICARDGKCQSGVRDERQRVVEECVIQGSRRRSRQSRIRRSQKKSSRSHPC